MKSNFGGRPLRNQNGEVVATSHSSTSTSEYFSSLEEKLILKSHKLSNFMGSQANKLAKAHSLNLNEDSTDLFSPSSDSGSKASFDSNFHLKNPKLKTNPKCSIGGSLYNAQTNSVSSNKSDSLKYAMDLKKKLSQKVSSKSSTVSSKEGHRRMAYDYDFVAPELESNLLNRRRSPEKSKNLFELQRAAEYQKRKMTETISTNSSHRLESIKTPVAKQTETCGKISLSEFEIIKNLGEGKFGVVSLARHKTSNMICALKKMPKYFEDQCIVEQLIREIKIQSFLEHPNICQLYNFFVENEQIYLILEICDSGNVYNVLKKEGRFSEEKVKDIIRQVCYAIEYLHEHDIIHRDIKPENILFHENVVKLCDFGWSVYSPLSRGTLCGTPIYASPELVQKKQYDGKIDIWNIGVLTYELIYGRVPFEIRCEEDLQKVVSEEIYFPKMIEISEGAKDFIRQCLNKNPEYRISIAKVLDHDFIYQKREPIRGKR